MTATSAETFESLLAPVLDRAYAAAYQFTRNPAEAEDLVQEAALLAWRGFAGFQAGSSFRAWFLRILTNKFISDYRRNRRRGTSVEVDEVPELYLWRQSRDAGLHDASEDPATDLLGRLDAEQVSEAMDRLPEEYRIAATLYFMQDLSYQEIAEVLGVPVGTVRSRLHRGRKLLQRSLWSVAREHGIVPAAAGDQEK